MMLLSALAQWAGPSDTRCGTCTPQGPHAHLCGGIRLADHTGAGSVDVARRSRCVHEHPHGIGDLVVALLNPSPALPLPVTMWTLARSFTAGKRRRTEELLAEVCPPSLRKASTERQLPDETSPASNQSVAALRALQDL